MSLLSDHKREGKKFVPPLRQFPNLHLSNWQRDQLPEIIWIGLLLDAFGYKRTCSILDLINDNVVNFDKSLDGRLVFMSSFHALDSASFPALLRSDTSSLAKEVKKTLLPLSMYPGCPIASPPSVDAKAKSDLIKNLTRVCEEMLYKRERFAMLTISAAFRTFARSQRLVLTDDVLMPNLNAIEFYPDTEESRSAGSFIRAALGSIYATDLPNGSEWSRHFWDHSRVLTPCI